MQNQDLDNELVAWDSWCEVNESDQFAQERGLDKQTRAELKGILKIGDDIWRFAEGGNPEKVDAFTAPLKTTIFFGWFAASKSRIDSSSGVCWSWPPARINTGHWTCLMASIGLSDFGKIPSRSGNWAVKQGWMTLLKGPSRIATRSSIASSIVG